MSTLGRLNKKKKSFVVPFIGEMVCANCNFKEIGTPDVAHGWRAIDAKNQNGKRRFYFCFKCVPQPFASSASFQAFYMKAVAMIFHQMGKKPITELFIYMEKDGQIVKQGLN